MGTACLKKRYLKVLSSVNKVQAYNGCVMPVLRYFFSVLKWTQSELDALDIRVTHEESYNVDSILNALPTFIEYGTAKNFMVSFIGY